MARTGRLKALHEGMKKAAEEVCGMTSGRGHREREREREREIYIYI